jgi:hypothetical protein
MDDQTLQKPVSSRFGMKKGWRNVSRHTSWKMDVKFRLEQLMHSQVASDEAKERARQFLLSIVDGRMPVENFEAARTLIKSTPGLTNKRLAQAAKANEIASNHAVFMACQACENLRDREVKIASRKDRNQMIAQVAAAISALSDLQIQLIEGSDD